MATAPQFPHSDHSQGRSTRHIPSDSPRAIHQSAETYVSQGWSIIPLYGEADSTRPKQPPIKWQDYQKRLPTSRELGMWFMTHKYPAMGIVTGGISNLVVLDFDSTDLYLAFASACPQLVNTYTVKTARGRHLYFHTPALIAVPSCKIPGLDVQADGRYVVAPPSMINGHRYTIQGDLPPHILTPSDVEQIKQFLRASDNSSHSPARPAARQTHPAQQPSLENHYTDLATQHGSRNTALYRLSHEARRSGYTETQTREALADLHATTRPVGTHNRETYEQRLQEANHTIHSAYQARYAAPRTGQVVPDGTTVCDQAVREHLLQRDKVEGTAFLRVYEGLLSQGVKPGDDLTYAQMYGLLSPLGIGRPAIIRALKTEAEGNARLIQPQSAPFPRTHTRLTTDLDKEQESFSCFQPVRPQNGVQTSNHTKTPNTGGRPPQHYRFPAVNDLCQRLGIRPAGGGDPLKPEALASPAAYRCALEHAFIKRRPDKYYLGLLAGRLGVSHRTIQRYHTQSGVFSHPTYDRVVEIDWLNLDDEFEPNRDPRKPSKYCLQDDRGQRYLERRETAEWLLKRKRRVWIMKRGPNFYWVDAPPLRLLAQQQVASYLLFAATPGKEDDAVSRLTRSLEQFYETSTAEAAHPASRVPDSPTPEIWSQHIEELTRAAIWNSPERPATEQLSFLPKEAKKPKKPRKAKRPKPKRFYRDPLRDQYHERLAQQVHAFTNPNKSSTGAGKTDSKGLLLSNARQLVDVYGYEAVSTALNRAVYKQEHGTLYSPSGFIVTVARTAWLEEHPDVPHQERPRFEAEKRAKRSPGYRAEYDEIWLLLRTAILLTDETYLAWRRAFWAALGKSDPLLNGYQESEIETFTHPGAQPEELPY
ncbi:MAG: bifunctional DNA primase/polymerase [Anaerolineae bacterium]|nr:bifunctional DNA primase/polymerase [Anaerolineae bacterium]